MLRLSLFIRALIALLAFNLQQGEAASSCYYPDGTIAGSVAPCFSGGGQCCPFQYQCMSNGLCYLENEDQYMRASCTDQTWQADFCPQICTQNNTASGNEAMLHCDNQDGLWCCDGNRSWNCCSQPPQTFIKLDVGTSAGTILSTPNAVTQTKTVTNSPATAATGTTVNPGEPSQQPTTKAKSTSSRSSSKTIHHSSRQSSPTSKASPSTLTHKTVTTDSSGSVITSTVVTTEIPTGTGISTADQNHPTKHNGSNLGFIVGLALGIPLFLLVISLIVFCLYRRRRKTPRQPKIPQPSSPPMEASYLHPTPDGRAPELEGYPVAPLRTKSGRKSELEGDFHYSPATPTTPNGGFPPQYSPAKTMTPIQEAPVELWGGHVPYRPDTYIPYRPPQVEETVDSGT